MPHGMCYLWRPDVLALHIISDALIALAYFSIPFTLFYFVAKRRDLTFQWVFLCFGIFIVACGATHLMDIVVIWYPLYWISGGIKAVTALASVPTAILLVKLVPQAIGLASPAALERANSALGREIEVRIRVEAEVRQLNDVLEARVIERTGELLSSVQSLEREIAEHMETETKYRGLLEAAPDAIVVVDQEGDIVLLNLQAETQFGYRRDELVGQPIKNIIPEGFAERLVSDSTRSASEALAQQIGTGIELTGRRKNGSQFPIEIMLSPLESAEGILVTAAIRDITERKKSENHLVNTVDELKRSNDELEHFAYVASHDLQEPLRMVASYTQLLAQRYKGRLGSDADEFIAFAVDGSTRMRQLIQDLLAYSRAGAPGKPRVEVSSETALQDAISNLRTTIAESGAIVSHDPLPVITTDARQLTAIFQNLIGNAIKYRGTADPVVHISAAAAATKDGSYEWIFSVRDNGIGIDPQYFKRIFVLFQRLHGRHEFEGTGIGLAICKKVLERLGGRIWLESQPGHGSTFYFSLPKRGGA
jgi:PAS domain S-box-containing protein